jgi:hypothetical protein
MTWQANVLTILGYCIICGEIMTGCTGLEEGFCARQSGYYIRTEALLLISFGIRICRRFQPVLSVSKGMILLKKLVTSFVELFDL